MHKLEISNKVKLEAEFREEIHRSEKTRFLHRLHCILLVSEGFSSYDLARWFGENPRTVERWVHHYNEWGIEGLKEGRKPGRPAKLKDEQLQRLQKDILKKPIAFGYAKNEWDGNLLAMHLNRYYRTALSVRQCQRLLRQLQKWAEIHEKGSSVQDKIP